MSYVIGAIWNLLELQSVYYFNGSFLFRKENNQNNINKVLLVLLFTCIYSNFPINHYVKMIFTISAYSVLSILLLQGTFVVHACLSIICFIFITAIETISINSMCYLLGISLNTFIWRKLSYLTLVTAEKLLALFFTWILNRSRRKGNLGKQHSKWIQLSALFPIISAMMLTFLFYNSPRNEDVSLGIVFFGAILIVANFAMIYVINSIEKSTERDRDLRLLRQQISIQTENYRALKENYSVQRKSTHEFERHIQVIRDLLDQKEYESAQDYVRQLQANRTLKVFSISSNNPVIDVVLNQKHQVAQENGIKMRVKVNDLSAITIGKNELVVLISNLLDNAIEACMRIENNREIVCNILMEGNIYLSIRNTSLPVTIIHGEIPTTKQETTEHGYGLQAVRYILDQLNAEYTFAYNDGWFQFVAEIPG